MKYINLIGYATGNGAENHGCGAAPEFLKQSDSLNAVNINYPVQWQTILHPEDNDIEKSHIPTITWLSQQLAKNVKQSILAEQFFITIGGDHSSGIGTWSGAADAYSTQGDIGLIWFDAHLDAHTYETTPSGNIHGMPVACLLGYGHKDLTSIMSATPKLKPENLVYIGARSYEDGEHELLKKLNIKIYYMEQVKQFGIKTIFQEAISIVKKNTIAYGLSLDLDGIDPQDAPGVGCPADDGISAQSLLEALDLFAHDNKLIGAEVVEFNPALDREQKTEKLTVDILQKLYSLYK
jgi:arginase